MRLAKTLAIAAGLVSLAASALVPPGIAHSATTPTVVLSNDFEDATSQGWFARGSASVAVSTTAAHAGTRSLLTTNRTATWQGPGRSVLGVLTAGATYTIEAQARLLTGAPASSLYLTMQRTPAGGSTTYQRVASASVTDADWVSLRGDYTFTGDSTDQQLYLESADATVSFYVDDITVTMTAPPPGGPADEAGVTSDFESGTTQGWAPRVSAEQLSLSPDAHSGQYALLTTNRAHTFDGPALNVLGKISKGKTYTISVWVKLPAGDAPASLRLSLERRLSGTPSYETLVGNTTVTATNWVHLTSRYTLGNDVDFLAVYLESASGTPSFLMDDFALTYVVPLPIQTDIPSLRDVFADDFRIGTAIDRTETVGVHSELLLKHFSSITPGNALKWDATEPDEGQFSWTEADAQVGFGVANGLGVRGHTLVWHSQTPTWVFQHPDGTPLTATAEDKALLLSRLESHIRAVVGRYRDQIYAWDVANEVIDEYSSDGLRHSPWYEITGLDFIRTAFRVAHEVAPAAKLYLNDYNTELPRKRQIAYDLISRLRAEGVPIDGIGHQMHLNVARPAVSDIEQTIELFAGLGVDQQITELDMSVYPNFVDSYPAIPAQTLIAQGYRYRDLFDALRRQHTHLSAVTLWGQADDNTWLRNFPIPRLDDPLLFDDGLQAKPAYWGVVDPSRLAPLTRTLNAPAGTAKIDAKRDLTWDLTPGTEITNASGLTATFSARWDAGYLYLLAEVVDATNDKTDTVEVFVDEDNGKTSAYGADDAHYVIQRGGTSAHGFAAHTKKLDNGYRVEAALPLSLAGTAGRTIGLDVRVRDASTPGADLSWNDQTHGQDADTSRWGTLTLVGEIPVVDAPKATPTVDGVVDAVWACAPVITTTVRLAGTGATATAQLLWDAHHLYLLATVTDPTIDESSANAYEQDSVEIFVDPANNKGTGYDDDDGQYRVSASNHQSIGGTFGAFAIADNLTSATRLVPGGYVVEASIELDTITPDYGGLLGFDLQVNDATAGTRTAATTWHDPSGMSYLDTSGWGVARLVSR